MKKKLLVLTRSADAGDAWKKYLERRGFVVYHFPTIEIVLAKPTPKLLGVLKNISDFDWVVFTSAAGVRSLSALALAKTTAAQILPKINIAAARMPRVAVVGSATAAAARAAGYRVAFQPSAPSSAALAFELDPVRGQSILLLRTSIAPPDLRNALIARGATVTELPIYKTILRRDPDPKFEKLLAAGRIDFLTFASPSAVRGFFMRAPRATHMRKKFIDKARTVPAIAIGPSVAAALTKAGFKDVRMVEEPTVEAVGQATDLKMA